MGTFGFAAPLTVARGSMCLAISGMASFITARPAPVKLISWLRPELGKEILKFGEFEVLPFFHFYRKTFRREIILDWVSVDSYPHSPNHLAARIPSPVTEVFPCPFGVRIEEKSWARLHERRLDSAMGRRLRWGRFSLFSLEPSYEGCLTLRIAGSDFVS